VCGWLWFFNGDFPCANSFSVWWDPTLLKGFQPQRHNGPEQCRGELATL
jgi:hypothetical protein